MDRRACGCARAAAPDAPQFVLAATAFVSGMALTWRTGLSFATPWIAFPIGVFVATAVIGSSYSLPEYGRLVRLLGARGANDAEIQHRIEIAAWVNRIELVLVLCGVVGIVVQLG